MEDGIYILRNLTNLLNMVDLNLIRYASQDQTKLVSVTDPTEPSSYQEAESHNTARLATLMGNNVGLKSNPMQSSRFFAALCKELEAPPRSMDLTQTPALSRAIEQGYHPVQRVLLEKQESFACV